MAQIAHLGYIIIVWDTLYYRKCKVWIGSGTANGPYLDSRKQFQPLKKVMSRGGSSVKQYLIIDTLDLSNTKFQ